MIQDGEMLIELRGIVKEFPGVLALDRVDFDLKRGEVHVLVGENGAGKSTLIKILTGAYSCDEGTIILRGHPVQIENPRRAQELGISVIYQEFNLVPNISVAENVFLGREPLYARPGIINWRAMERAAALVLRELGVVIDPRAIVKTLGVAHQQMVEIARALSMKADIIVMDEPTSALSEREIAELFDAIRSLRGRGVGIIYISHRLQEVFEVGDRVTVLRDGRRIQTLPLAEADVDLLIRLMVGREIREKFPKVSTAIGVEVLAVRGLRRWGVLHDITFSLRKGEILGVAGLMGAGKSELARALFGADPIDDGTIVLEGRPFALRTPAQAIRNGIALLPEDRKAHGLVLSMGVRENLTLPILPSLSPFWVLQEGRERTLAQEFVRRLRIRTPHLDQPVRFLSGGNQQKVVLAKWLLSRARVFIFVEPTRGIDVGAKVEVYQLMNTLVAEGGAIIMFSSELPEILGMSDRILVMHEGRINGEFRRGEATQDAILRCATGHKPSAEIGAPA